MMSLVMCNDSKLFALVVNLATPTTNLNTLSLPVPRFGSKESISHSSHLMSTGTRWDEESTLSS